MSHDAAAAASGTILFYVIANARMIRSQLSLIDDVSTACSVVRAGTEIRKLFPDPRRDKR